MITFYKNEINRALEQENENLKVVNENLKVENASLIDKIFFFESQLSSLKNEIQKMQTEKLHTSNKREKFVDIKSLITHNQELKDLNNQLTNALEDMKKENEIILDDYRKIQLTLDELQAKYHDILEENAQLKTSIYNMKNISNIETRNAAEKPKIFFENNNPNVNNWSTNHFSVKKTEFPYEFTKSKWVNVTENNSKKNNDLRLSNYKEKDQSFSKNQIELEAKTVKTTYSKHLVTSKILDINENNNVRKNYESFNLNKKATDPEIIFPYKKNLEYFESKTENILKGKMVDFKPSDFKQFENSRNLDEFKLNCLISKATLFSNEIFGITVVLNNNIAKNNILKFNMIFCNLSKKFIENFKINFIADDSSLFLKKVKFYFEKCRS